MGVSAQCTGAGIALALMLMYAHYAHCEAGPASADRLADLAWAQSFQLCAGDDV